MEYAQEDRDRLIRIEGKLDDAFQRIDDIEHDLYGNGRPGLVSEHAVLRTLVDERTSPAKAAGAASALTAAVGLVLAAIGRHLGL